METKPISLIQWLGPNEDRETQAALSAFAEDEVKIFHADVLTKVEAKHALQTWFSENGANTQYCFIGAHGIVAPDGRAIGVGVSDKPNEFAEWQELWDWFDLGNLRGGLWLGACNSSDAAAALSPFLNSLHLAIPHIYGFSGSIYPNEIEEILKKLIAFTDIENPPSLPEEPAELRKAVPGTKIELYYPAPTLAGTTEYVNVDEMPEKTGMDFRQLLEQQNSRRPR